MKIRALKPQNRWKTSNVQHRTSNAEVSEDSRCHSMFGLGCSMLDVPLGSWVGRTSRIWTRIGAMNPPPTPPEEGSQCRARLPSSPPGRGQGWVGSWKAPFRFLVCIGTMNQIGTPLPALSPQGGERWPKAWRGVVHGEPPRFCDRALWP